MAIKRMRFTVTPKQLQEARERWLRGDYSHPGSSWDWDAAVLADAYCELVSGGTQDDVVRGEGGEDA